MQITLKANRKFQDKYTKEVCLPGTSIATEEIDRVNDLVKRGLCEIVSIEEVANDNADNGGANDGAGADGGESNKTKKGK